MSSEEDPEAAAICALLDAYDGSEALEWLAPAEVELEVPFVDAEVAQSTCSSVDTRSEASNTTRFERVEGHKTRRSSSAKPGKKQADPNRARNERRLELIYLRRQAAELERHLGELKGLEPRRWRSLAIADDFQRSGGAKQLRIVERLYPSLGSMSLWESLARDERSKRVRAETENTRLRLLVDSQVKTANQLKRILVPKRARNARSYLDDCFSDGDACRSSSDSLTNRKSTAALTATASFVTVRPGPPPFTRVSGLSSSQIFEMLKDKVACARREMDVLFMENGLATAEKSYRSARIEQDAPNGTLMELVASKALPYGMEATRQAAWRHFVDLYPVMPDRTSFEYNDKRENVHTDGVDKMLAESYRIEVGNGVVSAKLDEWRVLRQFVEPDRIVIIYCIVSEASEFVSKPISGIRILKQIFIVLRRASRHAGVGETVDAAAESTVLQFYYRFQPAMYKLTPGLDRVLYALTDFLFGFISGRVGINYEMIEQELRAAAGDDHSTILTST